MGKIKDITIQIGLALFIAGVIGGMLVSYVRTNYQDVSNAPPSPDSSSVRAWLTSVEKDDGKKAVIQAKKMIDDERCEYPELDYMRFFSQNRVKSTFLTDPISDVDMERWRSALKFKKLAEELTHGKRSVCEALITAVDGKVAVERGEARWPSFDLYDVWTSGKGRLEGKVMILAELCEQAHVDMCVVTLFNDKGMPVHMLCELRKDGERFVYDPFFRVARKGGSVADWIENPQKIPENWPVSIRNSLKRIVYHVPVDPADFRLCNQKLGRLLASGGSDAPIFGMPPLKRVEKMMDLYGNEAKHGQFRYWPMKLMALTNSEKFNKKKWMIANGEKGKKDR